MAYTQKRFPNDEAEFPTPPLWLVWNSDVEYNNAHHDPARGGWVYEGMTTRDAGQIRHQPTLEKAKKNVHTRSHATGNRKDNTFWGDWAIYKWEDNRYVLMYSGIQGDLTKDHPLWAKGVAKDGTIGEPRDILADEYNSTIASILTAVRT